MRKSAAITIAILLLSGCGEAASNQAPERPATPPDSRTGPPPPPSEPRYGAAEPMSGVYATRFEHADFNGCWLSMSHEAAGEFTRLFPRDSADYPTRGRRYRLEIVGRPVLATPGGPEAFGHMGGWRCEIQATRIVSARVLGQF